MGTRPIRSRCAPCSGRACWRPLAGGGVRMRTTISSNRTIASFSGGSMPSSVFGPLPWWVSSLQHYPSGYTKTHIQAFTKPGILWSGPGHLFELDPLLATSVWEALRDDHVALALVVSRQAPEGPKSHLKGGKPARFASPSPPEVRFRPWEKRRLQLLNPPRDGFHSRRWHGMLWPRIIILQYCPGTFAGSAARSRATSRAMIGGLTTPSAIPARAQRGTKRDILLSWLSSGLSPSGSVAKTVGSRRRVLADHCCVGRKPESKSSQFSTGCCA